MWRRHDGTFVSIAFDGERMTAHTGQNNGKQKNVLPCLSFCHRFWYPGSFSLFCGFDSVVLLEKLPVLLSIFFCAAIRRPVQFSVIRFHQAVYNPLTVYGQWCPSASQLPRLLLNNFAVCRLFIRKSGCPKPASHTAFLKRGLFCFIIF